MSVPFWIAKRYFFSLKKARFISIVSVISMLGVAVGTMALVLVLSVFNGLEGLIRKLHHTLNPDLKVIAAQGKSFGITADWMAQLQTVEGVAYLTEIIEDNAVLRYQDVQMVVNLKGVSENYRKQSNVERAMVRGEFTLRRGNTQYAVTGRGVQRSMGISLSNQTDLMELWYPKRSKKISLGEINPEKNFNRKFILPVGIFAVEQQYDEKYVFVPISFAESLLEYNQRRTSLEIKVKPNYTVAQVQKALQKKLGSQFVVQNTDEQQAGLLKAIQIEKFFVYITLSFVLAVASFNIFFSLTMLAIEKKKDIAVLYTLGAEVGTIRRIFIFEGVLISLIGATLGMTTGLGICLLQQQFGIIPMGTATTIVSAYPVELRLNDFLFSALSVIIITLLSSVPPALRIDPTQVKAYL
ncbi:MAG TPA: hypothetical protein DCM08_03010 [Microscillaceae bacterium]|jgi:lipoprotein-releasing system permease protein|nr:hypothetical protein [Microscillaceae bacterium]